MHLPIEDHVPLVSVSDLHCHACNEVHVSCMGTSLLPYKMLNGCKLLIVHAFCVCRNILTLKNSPDCFFIFLIPSCHCCIFGVYLFILVEILHVYLQNTMQLYFCFALIQDELFLNQTKQILKMCGAQTVLIVIFNMFFLQ